MASSGATIRLLSDLAIDRRSCCRRLCARLRLLARPEEEESFNPDSWTELGARELQSERSRSNSKISREIEDFENSQAGPPQRFSGSFGAPPSTGRTFIVEGCPDDDVPSLGSFLDSYFEVRSDSEKSSVASEEVSPEELEQMWTQELEMWREMDALHEEEPLEIYCFPHRRGAVSAEAHGVWNQRHANHMSPSFRKSMQTQRRIFDALKECPFIASLNDEALDAVVDALPTQVFGSGACIMSQGEPGDTAFILLDGEAQVYNENEAGPSFTNTGDKGRSVFVRNLLPGSFLDVFDAGSSSTNTEVKSRGAFVRTIPAGRLFGEMSMLWRTPRTRSVYAKKSCMVASLHRDTFQKLVVHHNMKQRDRREECLRQVALLETLNVEQIAGLADALETRVFSEGGVIIRQGDWGEEFFIIVSGECIVEVETSGDIQTHGILGPASLFGERALITRTTRSATIRAKSDVEVFCLRRRCFERLLGPLGNLHSQNYLSDPRKCIADFFRSRGPAGPRASVMNGTHRASLMSGIHTTKTTQDTKTTEWFAVYRPTSRDAIAKMIGGTAVGKGLNVKGKSAKKNRLSGYVPFLQFYNNAQKSEIEDSPPDARLRLFFPTAIARQMVLVELQAMLLPEANLEFTTERAIHLVDDYVPNVFGLDLPEMVLREAYITRPDLTPLAGWETGRKSEPAFMNMNLHALREPNDLCVVLYQWDVDNPMNPHGLLIAYAEEHVKPVVSDFDTFTVGSRRQVYERLTSEQCDLANWALQHTLEILRQPSIASWNSCWLQVLKQSSQEGFHPKMPKYGFGDETSYQLIESAVEWTKATGAVRHGAESFNFYFPQELDEEFLIVWDEFPDKPWAYKTEEQLREFLLERIDDGYCFPLNPVWPVRDAGWYQIFDALDKSPGAQHAMEAWYPPDSGISQRIRDIHAEFPLPFHSNGKPTHLQRLRKTKTEDCDACESADLGLYQQTRNNFKQTRRMFHSIKKMYKKSRGISMVGDAEHDSPLRSTPSVPRLASKTRGKFFVP